MLLSRRTPAIGTCQVTLENGYRLRTAPESSEQIVEQSRFILSEGSYAWGVVAASEILALRPVEFLLLARIAWAALSRYGFHLGNACFKWRVLP